MERAPEHLFPMVLSIENTKGDNIESNPAAQEFRPERLRRNAKAIAELRITDQAGEEGNVPHVE